MNDHDIPEDLSIPVFLRATGPGTPHIPNGIEAAAAPADAWPFAVRRDNCTAADIAAMHELAGRQAERQAVADYHDQARLAELQQWAIENPELAAMERKASRDRKNRIARMGIPPASSIRRKR